MHGVDQIHSASILSIVLLNEHRPMDRRRNGSSAQRRSTAGRRGGGGGGNRESVLYGANYESALLCLLLLSVSQSARTVDFRN